MAFQWHINILLRESKGVREVFFTAHSVTARLAAA